MKVCDHVVVKSVVKCGQIALAHPCKLLKELGPQVGLEPTTLRLTGGTSVVSRTLPALAGGCLIARLTCENRPVFGLRFVPLVAAVGRPLVHAKGKKRAKRGSP